MSKHSHPMIYMKGFTAADMVDVMDFVYHGEIYIYQDDLDWFLALAEELQLKGLASSKIFFYYLKLLGTVKLNPSGGFREPENPVNSPMNSNQKQLNIPKQEVVQHQATTKKNVMMNILKI